MKILGIIPARGGSKGIPNKNLSQIGGRSLLEITIDCARRSNKLDRVIVSTDSEKIAAVGRHFNAEVPFMRPKEIAADDTPDFPVFLNVINWLSNNENYKPDLMVWLRPTSPLRNATDISNAIKILEETGADSVRSVCKVSDHPYWMKIMDQDLKINPVVNNLDERKYYRRQLLPDVYRLNGVVEVIRVSAALSHNYLYGTDIRGYVMPPSRSLDIDTYEDLRYAEFLLQNS